MRAAFIYLICLFSCTSSAQKSDTTYHSIVSNGYITGEQKMWKEGKNEYHYMYYYNDRGRGPNVKETVHTNDNGQIISATATGVDYLKSPYSASFSILNDSAILIENGVKKSQKYNNEIYRRTRSSIRDIVLQWLLKQPNKKGFDIEHDSLSTIEPVKKTISYLGKSIKLQLFFGYGDKKNLPNYSWMTEDMHFFAGVGPLGGIILKGYENWTDTLFAIQEEQDQDYFSKQLKQYSKPLINHLLITNATLFISSTASVKKNMSVEVVGDKIVSIFPSANKSIHADTVIDAKGKFLMPGLWDMHCHFGKNSGVWYLAGGVTHVRDMASLKFTQTFQKEIRSNNLLGPDISYLSGFIDKEGPLQAPSGKIVPSLEKALEAIDYYHQLRYNQIKLYSSIKPEWVKPLADRAHSLGMRVAGHVPAYMTAEQAINAGYNEITHNNMIFLNFMGADTLATNGMARMFIPATLSGTIDLNSKEVQSFVQLMKKKSIAHDPTLRIIEGLYAEFKGDTSKIIKPIISWMPTTEKTDIANTSSFGKEEQKPAYMASFKNSLKMVKLLYDNGILLVAGTDGGEAIALHRELEIYNEAGIPANEVLKIATYNAAKDCNLEKVYGQIKVGRDADFILIDGNPAKNISDIRRVEWVIKNGRMYSPKQLYASQNWKYYY